MSKINFISHESFPADQYTKELVYLEINVPARVLFSRKEAKNGGLFWSVASVAVTKNGQKEFFPAYIQDSNFLEKDIKAFLDNRRWESGSVQTQTNCLEDSHVSKPQSMYEVAEQVELPF